MYSALDRDLAVSVWQVEVMRRDHELPNLHTEGYSLFWAKYKRYLRKRGGQWKRVEKIDSTIAPDEDELEVILLFSSFILLNLIDKLHSVQILKLLFEKFVPQS